MPTRPADRFTSGTQRGGGNAQPTAQHIIRDVLIGLGAATLAVSIRLLLPLSPVQLPTITVVVAMAFITTFVGLLSGIVTSLAGGLLAWYFLLEPYSINLDAAELIPMTGFLVISASIITTAHLYRSSQRHRRDAELARLRESAGLADHYAREMAHRLKNALTIAQSIAFQTLDAESEETARFSGRLKALADANDLLSEHLYEPTAAVSDVISAALAPSPGAAERVRIESAHVRIAGRQVVTLALVLHELADNAGRYGALSGAKGWVALRVEERDSTVDVQWTEHDGPAPHASSPQEGFGLRLLRRLGGTDLRFQPTGLQCRLSLRKG